MMKKLFSGGGNDKSSWVGKSLLIGRHQCVIEELIAEGGFALVFLVKTSGGQRYALKRVSVNEMKNLEMCKQEIDVLKMLSGHKNTIGYIDSIVNVLSPGIYEVLILMEYCKAGHVVQLMNECIQTGFTEKMVMKIFCDVTEAVALLHAHNPPIIHRDLKVENVLRKQTGDFVLCDYGSTYYGEMDPEVQGIQDMDEEISSFTTLAYRAPEMVDLYSGQKITIKSDVWAMGCLLYKLCFFTTPFGESTLAIQSGQFTFPETSRYSDKMYALIKMMLVVDQSKRADIFQVANIAFQMTGKPCPVRNISVKPVKQPQPQRPIQPTSAPKPHTAPKPHAAPKPHTDIVDADESRGQYDRQQPSQSAQSQQPARVQQPVSTSLAPRQRPKGVAKFSSANDAASPTPFKSEVEQHSAQQQQQQSKSSQPYDNHERSRGQQPLMQQQQQTHHHQQQQMPRQQVQQQQQHIPRQQVTQQQQQIARQQMPRQQQVFDQQRQVAPNQHQQQQPHYQQQQMPRQQIQQQQLQQQQQHLQQQQQAFEQQQQMFDQQRQAYEQRMQRQAYELQQIQQAREQLQRQQQQQQQQQQVQQQQQLQQQQQQQIYLQQQREQQRMAEYQQLLEQQQHQRQAVTQAEQQRQQYLIEQQRQMELQMRQQLQQQNPETLRHQENNLLINVQEPNGISKTVNPFEDNFSKHSDDVFTDKKGINPFGSEFTGDVIPDGIPTAARNRVANHRAHFRSRSDTFSDLAKRGSASDDEMDGRKQLGVRDAGSPNKSVPDVRTVEEHAVATEVKSEEDVTRNSDPMSKVEAPEVQLIKAQLKQFQLQSIGALKGKSRGQDGPQIRMDLGKPIILNSEKDIRTSHSEPIFATGNNNGEQKPFSSNEALTKDGKEEKPTLGEADESPLISPSTSVQERRYIYVRTSSCSSDELSEKSQGESSDDDVPDGEKDDVDYGKIRSSSSSSFEASLEKCEVAKSLDEDISSASSTIDDIFGSAPFKFESLKKDITSKNQNLLPPSRSQAKRLQKTQNEARQTVSDKNLATNAGNVSGFNPFATNPDPFAAPKLKQENSEGNATSNSVTDEMKLSTSPASEDPFGYAPFVKIVKHKRPMSTQELATQSKDLGHPNRKIHHRRRMLPKAPTQE